MKSNQLFIFSTQTLKARSGMVISQVVLLFTLVGSLTITLLLTFGSNKVPQGQLAIQNQLAMMQEQIRFAISDSSSWHSILLNPSNDSVINCLRFNSGIVCNHSGAPELSDADLLVTKPNSDFVNANYLQLRGVIRSDGAELSSVPQLGSGFTDQGRPCTTFAINPANGDPNCPISWDVRTQFLCPSGATCRNPDVRFVALLYYHPGPNARPEQTINQNRFRLVQTRGATGPLKNESFQASFGNSSNSPPPGGGLCSPLNWIQIPLTSVNDTASPANATLDLGSIVLEPGTYNCSASTSCWQCGAVAVQLFDTSGNRPLGTSSAALAGPNVLATAYLKNAKFTLNGKTRVELRHYCQSLPGGGMDQYSMGMPVRDYTNNIFAIARCVRIH